MAADAAGTPVFTLGEDVVVGPRFAGGSFGAVCSAVLNLPGQAPIQVAAKYSTWMSGENGVIAPTEYNFASTLFKREADTLWRATGPSGIIKCYGIVRKGADEVHYIVTERLPESLYEALHVRHWQPTSDEIEKVMCDLSRGLRHLHSMDPQIAHRDLTSKNVLVDVGACRAVLGDYGQAKTLRGRTGHGSDSLAPGALPYCAPETLIERAPVNDRMDCFSLGVVLLELVTGQFPDPKALETMVNGAVVRRLERERRKGHISLVGDVFLKRVISACLDNNALGRPSARVLATTFETLCGVIDITAAATAIEALAAAGEAQCSLVEDALLLRQERNRASVTLERKLASERRAANDAAAAELEALRTQLRAQEEAFAARFRAQQLESERKLSAATDRVSELQALCTPRPGPLRDYSVAVAPRVIVLSSDVPAFPRGLAVTASGNIVVATPGNNRLQIVRPDGSFVRNIAAPGDAIGELAGPAGLTVDRDGRIIVADRDNHRLQIFSEDGTSVGIVGGRGSGLGQLLMPNAVAIDCDGNIIVCDSGNHRLQVFSSAGVPQRTIGSEGTGPGQFQDPVRIAVCASNWTMVVTEDNGRRCHLLAGNGRFLRFLGMEPGPGFITRPLGIAVDAAGNIIIAEWKRKDKQDRIVILRPDGTFLREMASHGTGPGQFDGIHSLAVTARGEILASDYYNSRVQFI